MFIAPADLLTPIELCAALKISRRTYSRLMADGRIPFKTIGTLKRFVYADVLAALPSGPKAPPARAVPSGGVNMVAYLKHKAAHWGR